MKGKSQDIPRPCCQGLNVESRKNRKKVCSCRIDVVDAPCHSGKRKRLLKVADIWDKKQKIKGFSPSRIGLVQIYQARRKAFMGKLKGLVEGKRRD